MTSGDDLLLRLIADKVKMRRLVGTFVEATATGCTVDVGNGRIPARFGSGYLPEVNETVEVWIFDDDTAYVMASTLTHAPQGTVNTVSGNTVLLDTAFGPVTAPFLGSAPAAGQVMALRWHGGPMALGVVSTPRRHRSRRFRRSSTDGARRHVPRDRRGLVQPVRVAAGAGLVVGLVPGRVVPGDEDRRHDPASAQMQRVELYLSPQQIRYAPPNFALHPHPTKPAGAPAFGATQPIAAAAGWIDLPSAGATRSRHGGGSFGVGVNHGGYSIFRSLAQDGMSGAIRITSVY